MPHNPSMTMTQMQAPGRSWMPVLVGSMLLLAGVGLALVVVLATKDDKGSGPAPTPNQPTVAQADTGPEPPKGEVPATVKASGKPITLGWAPTVDPKVLEAEVEPFHRYLEWKTGRPVPVVMADSYRDLSEQLQAGKVDLAVLPPLLYVRTKRANKGVEGLALKEFNGTIRSDAYLIVNQKSPVTSLAELKGKRFCFTNPNSTTGYFFPNAYIRKQGFDPKTFIGGIQWSRDHMQIIKDVIAGHCDVGGTYSGAVFTAEELGIEISKIRILGVTGYTPQDTLSARPDLPDEDKRMIRDALLEFSPKRHLGVEHVGKSQRMTGFEEPGPKAFQPLEEMVDAQDKAKLQ